MRSTRSLLLRLLGGALVLPAASALAQVNHLALTYNYNALVHTGEWSPGPPVGTPNVANNATDASGLGFRAISDRSLLINGLAGSLGTGGITGATGLTYSIVTTANTLDTVMLGNRGTGGLWPFNTITTDNIGAQPLWLPVANQGTPRISNISPILLDASTQIGVLYHISNGGGQFNCVLGFSDATSVTVRLAAPDWFGTGNPVPAAQPGVQVQARLGTTFNSMGNNDNPTPSGGLNVIEAVMTRTRILNEIGFDIAGKQLTSITFQERFDINGIAMAEAAGVRSVGIYAASVSSSIPAPGNDLCANATAVTDGVYTGSTGGSTGTATSSCSFNDTGDVWFKYTATHTGTARISLCGSSFDTTLAVYGGSCGSLGSELACNDDYCGTASQVEFATVQNQQYLVRIAGKNADRGTFAMRITSPPGVLAGPFVNNGSGHTYYLLAPSSWDEAEADAIALGGHLATINDSAENAWVLANVLNYDSTTTRRGWLGLVRPFTTWSDGTPISYTNWNAGEPNNAGGDENYAEMIGGSGLWNDARLNPGTNNFGIVEIPTPPLVPGGVGSANPNPVEQGRDTVITVVVTPAGPIPSTGITVLADLHLLGGSATQALTDLGGNVFSYTLSVPGAQAIGPYTINFHVADDQARFSDGSFTLNIIGRSWNEFTDGGADAGELPQDAQTVTGSGSLSAISGTNASGDVDMFLINICDPANFSASTIGGATWDTQLFLFDINKLGVASNDDEVGGTTLQSRITNQFVSFLPAGNYYLAISQFNRDPQDGTAQLIFNPPAPRSEVNGNGPGAPNPVTVWTGTTAGGGAYRIALTGACFVSTGPAACSIADIATEGNPDVQAGPDGFITGVDADAFIECFNSLTQRPNGSFIADVVGDFGVGPPNGFVEGVDADAFFEAYFLGC